LKSINHYQKITISFIILFLFYSTPASGFEIIAHRGAHVMWKQGTYDVSTGCEATHIFPPSAEYLNPPLIENTLYSIERAFNWGATMVEIDIRRSRDKQLMVIHEYDLACKTNGQGLVSEHDAAYLKTLDMGYGFTADEGKTYPFRGYGIGLIPTLQEVLDAFPGKKFLIHDKDSNQETGALLIALLVKRNPIQNKQIFYLGEKLVYNQIVSQVPEVRTFFPSRDEIKDCLMPYFLSLGLLGFKSECRGLNIGMNRKYAQQILGWPDNFLSKAKENGNPVYLMVDTESEITYFNGLSVAGVVTDYIHLIGPHYRSVVDQ